MSTDREAAIQMLQASVGDQIDGAMKDGAELAFEMCIGIARATARTLRGEQADVLNGYATGLEMASQTFLATVTTTPANDGESA